MYFFYQVLGPLYLLWTYIMYPDTSKENEETRNEQLRKLFWQKKWEKLTFATNKNLRGICFSRWSRLCLKNRRLFAMGRINVCLNNRKLAVMGRVSPRNQCSVHHFMLHIGLCGLLTYLVCLAFWWACKCTWKTALWQLRLNRACMWSKKKTMFSGEKNVFHATLSLRDFCAI
jgi:hypothetical protein